MSAERTAVQVVASARATLAASAADDPAAMLYASHHRRSAVRWVDEPDAAHCTALERVHPHPWDELRGAPPEWQPANDGAPGLVTDIAHERWWAPEDEPRRRRPNHCWRATSGYFGLWSTATAHDEAPADLARCYASLNPAHAIRAVTELVATIDVAVAWWQLKVVNRPERLPICADALVLYVPEASLSVAIEALGEQERLGHTGQVRSDWVTPIGEGTGWAVEPRARAGSAQSFGLHRARVFAELATAGLSDDAIESRCRAEDIDPRDVSRAWRGPA